MKARLKAMEEEVKAKEAQVRGQACVVHRLRRTAAAPLARHVHVLPTAICLPSTTLGNDRQS